MSNLMRWGGREAVSLPKAEAVKPKRLQIKTK